VRRYKLFLNRLQDEKGRYLKKKTQNHYLIALRNFLRYLTTKEDLAVLSVDQVELMAEGDREIKFLTDEQLDRLLGEPDCSRIGGLRDRAILEALFSTGLRVSELISLDVEDINFETGEVGVLGKGRRRRVVFISDSAAEALQNYLKKRRDEWEPLFIRHHGRPVEDDKTGASLRLGVRSVQKIVEKYADRAGLMLRPSPHTLRHTFATDLLRRGADLRSVQEMLGHKNVATTQEYTHVTNPQLHKVHRKFHRGNQ